MSIKILLFTLSEHGQTNPILAIMEELLLRGGHEVHVVSYVEVEKRVEDIAAPLSSRPTFHCLTGPRYFELYDKKMGNTDESDPSHLPTSRDLRVVGTIPQVLSLWDDATFLNQMDQARKLIDIIAPEMILVDFLFFPAREACRLSGRKWLISSGVQTLDITRMAQPKLKWLWHYPAFGSGHKYPMSWKDTLSSIYITTRIVITHMISLDVKDAIRFRKENGLEGLPQWMSAQSFQYICPSIPETDFPLVVPDGMKLCGPIVLDALKVQDVDPELFQWLNQASTVYIALGTHTISTEVHIRGILGGLLKGLSSDTQVLWKLHRSPKWEDLVAEILAQHGESRMLKDRRLRILSWVVPDPLSILQHPNVKCFVHYGGANSFFEACHAGVPQIILAKWYDLYENAIKAEYRGFGIYGNRAAAPNVEANEFSDAVFRIMGDSQEALKFQERAAWIRELCQKAGGKRTAVDYILKLAQGSIGESKN